MTYQEIHQLTSKQVKDLHHMYQSEWWTKGRKIADIQKMLKHSDVVIGFCESENLRLVAFARVLTDYVYKALIFDVIVESPYRSAGLGKALMSAIFNHPSLEPVAHFELYCLPEMIPFYHGWGFTEELGKLLFMRREL